jgi:hypothetical protein
MGTSWNSRCYMGNRGTNEEEIFGIKTMSNFKDKIQLSWGNCNNPNNRVRIKG